ncbi:hypothetical protein [Chamaesiphon sp.]
MYVIAGESDFEIKPTGGY